MTLSHPRFRVAHVILILLTAQRAAAQGYGRVSGTVVDTAGKPVAARVTVTAGGRTNTAETEGRFNERVSAGQVAVGARFIGYLPFDTSFLVGPGELTKLVIRLRPIQQLDTVRVTADANCQPMHIGGFSCRRDTRPGFFIDRTAIDSSPEHHPAGLFQDVPGFRVTPVKHGLAVESTTGWRCIVSLANGRRPSLANPIPRYKKEMIAIEAYPRAKDVPPEYQQYMWAGAHPCGIVNYWTSVKERR